MWVCFTQQHRATAKPDSMLATDRGVWEETQLWGGGTWNWERNICTWDGPNSHNHVQENGIPDSGQEEAAVPSDHQHDSLPDLLYPDQISYTISQRILLLSRPPQMLSHWRCPGGKCREPCGDLALLMWTAKACTYWTGHYINKSKAWHCGGSSEWTTQCCTMYRSINQSTH